MLEIPLNNEKNQEFNIILDEQECTIQIQSLNDNLYFSLYADDKQIIENTLVNIGIRILHNKPFDFKGNFVFIDTYSKADEQKNPNFMQLDTRFKLYFLTEEEDLRIGNNWNKKQKS